MQTTSQLLMIRPVNFGFNAETAVNNAFQVAGNDENAQQKAANEFDDFVLVLRNNGVAVTVINDTPEPYTPDSIFPNNWVSFHDDGSVVLYPMYAVNRRLERKSHVLEQIKNIFDVKELIDCSNWEQKEQYMEGTGSMVLDRDNRIAYACLSPRTSEEALQAICKKINYIPVVFDAVDEKGRAIYHTNVMMCVADKYVVICLDSIPNERERTLVKKTIIDSGKEIIEISLTQMNSFAGNMLQVHNNSKSEKLLVMSSKAYESLTRLQIEKLSAFNKIIHSPLTTIETNGGGSARCMMAEIHLPLKQ
jgi:hypothetical protein